MLKIRYTFPVVYHKNKLIVIGGREYGNDRAAIFPMTEQYDFEEQSWKLLGNLNVPRCTSNSFVYND